MTIEIRVGTCSAIVNSPQPVFPEIGSNGVDPRTLTCRQALFAAGMVVPRKQPPRRRKVFPENQSASNGPSDSGEAGRRYFRSACSTPSPSRSTRPLIRDCQELTLLSLFLQFVKYFPVSRQPVGHAPIPATPNWKCRSRFRRTHVSVRHPQQGKEPQSRP